MINCRWYFANNAIIIPSVFLQLKRKSNTGSLWQILLSVHFLKDIKIKNCLNQ